MRKHDVINEGVREDEPEKQPRWGPFLADRSPQPPERQHRRREEYRVLEWRERGNLRRPRQPSPVINEPLDADPHEPRITRSNPVNRLSLPRRDIHELPHLFIASHLDDVLRWM